MSSESNSKLLTELKEKFKDEPFTISELTKSTSERTKYKKSLKQLVDKGFLRTKKIGRSDIFWFTDTKSIPVPDKKASQQTTLKKEVTPKESESENKSELEQENVSLKARLLELERQIKKYELHINELEAQLQQYYEEVQKYKKAESYDDPWREIALEMAKALAEMRGVTLQEVLEYFGVPDDF